MFLMYVYDEEEEEDVEKTGLFILFTQRLLAIKK